jgi:hypothetical protein
MLRRGPKPLSVSGTRASVGRARLSAYWQTLPLRDRASYGGDHG